MCRYSDELKDLVWNNATTKDGYNPDQYRLDPCGAWMQKDKYNDRNSDFGWEIDHIYPQALLKEKGAEIDEIDAVENLRAMNWHNNVSKGVDYPVYHIAIKAEGDRNTIADEEYEVNKDRQEVLKKLYSKYI